LGKAYQRAVSWCPGIIFPTPYPQGYGATPPLPRPPQSACDVPRSMPEAAADGNAGCVVHRRRSTGERYWVTDRGGHLSATEPHHRVTTRRVATAPNHRAARGGGAAPAPAPPDRPTAPVTTADGSATGVVRRAVFSRLPEPAALVAYGHIRRRCRAPSLPASRVGTADCRILLRRSERVAADRTEGAHRSSRTRGSCAGQTTKSGTRNRMFSANFSPLSIPWRIGRSTPLPPGKKRPRGTLPPDRDGPRTGDALPCTARGWNAS
jgi:hypothetical protein